MKQLKFFASLLAVVAILSVNVYAQSDRIKDMTQDEWQNEINKLTADKSDLTTQVETLKSEIAKLKATNASLQSYEDCVNDIYTMLGATKADVDNFGKKLNALEAKIDAKESPKADRQAELDQMKGNKISALPMYYDRVHNQLQRKLDAWEEKPKEIAYTVVKGDYLWKIAKKKEHYDNPFAWPIIYKANRDKIKNPDLIFPKQVFTIPNLTDEEKAKYDKIRRNYKPAPPTQTQTGK